MNMAIGQFYEIDVDMKTPFTVCGGLQDNGQWCVPSAVRDRNGIAARDSWNIGGGDGFYVKIDPSDNNFAYAYFRWDGTTLTPPTHANRTIVDGYEIGEICPGP